MKSDEVFDSWNEAKKETNRKEVSLFFHERQIWWACLGINVGFEQDGKGVDFERPVVILKTYSTNACLVVPLTTSGKKGIYYFDLGKVDGREAKAIISQIRFIDKKRLVNKVGVLDESTFLKLKKAIIQINLE